MKAGRNAASTTTATTAPRWAVVAAWLTVCCTIPSCLWRLALAAGVDVGFTGSLRELYRGLDILAYVLVLSVGSELAASLTLGLVRPWGERLPAWVPRLGGRRVPPMAAVIPAVAGAFAVTALCAALTLAPGGPLANPEFPQGTARVVMGLCYAPMLAWGPLLLAVTLSYARRRRGEHRPAPTAALA
ncbi:hypothetical protein ACWEQL_03875 [Kitasatospora sp. NPDC004240]